MKKDVIYVDIEDDITSIIEKVKAAPSKIVALVPPKRIGALQSVVNLKLLQRAASGVQKRVVLITSNQALAGLAAGVAIPVAKNLQSKPEIASVQAPDTDEEDIIKGDELPVGELAATAPLAIQGPQNQASKPTVQPRQPGGNADKTASTARGAGVVGGLAAAAAAKPPKNKLKVPNFDNFRKKMFILGGLGILLVGFFVWALAFAPRAVVNIAASTTDYAVKKQLSIAPNRQLNADAGEAGAVLQEIRKTSSVDFTPTGKKVLGEKATGTVMLTNNDESDPVTVPAGSTFTTVNGRQFISESSVTVPGFRRVGGQDRPGTASVPVTAAAIGEEYNVGAQSLVSNDVTIGAAFDQATSGGSKREVTIVSDEDVAKAKEKLAATNADSVKDELKKQFKDDTLAVLESFAVSAGQPSVSPAVGQEATSGKLTAETKYSMVGVLRSDLARIAEADIWSQLNDMPNQKIYDNGIGEVRFTGFAAADGTYTVTLNTIGFVGPEIESSKVAERASGKRAGEIQADIQAIEGVESVDVQLSPFWVTRAPAKDKITVKFLVHNEEVN